MTQNGSQGLPGAGRLSHDPAGLRSRTRADGGSKMMPKRVGSMARALLAMAALSTASGGAQQVRLAANRPVTIKLGFESLPTRREPLIIGAATHLGLSGNLGYDAEHTLWGLRALGLTSFRDDVFRESYKVAGANRPGSLRAGLETVLQHSGTTPLLILNGDGAPTTPDAINRYVAYAGEVAARTRTAQPMFEIWNEWNHTAAPDRPPLTGLAKPDDPRSATRYAALAAAAIPAIRRVVPQARILVGAAATDPDWQWVMGIARSGVLRRATGLSVHIYNHCAASDRRTAADVIGQLEQLHRKLAAAGYPDYPIYLTEAGWPTTHGGGCVIGDDQAADNMGQLLFWAEATPWMKGVWLYELKDQGHDPRNVEDNFGVLRADYRPKMPQSCTVIDAALHARMTRGWRVERPVPNVVVVHAADRRGPMLIAWNERPELPATLLFGFQHPLPSRKLCETATTASDAVVLGTRPVIIGAAGLQGPNATVRLTSFHD